jgi:hypothetical protein
MPPIRVRHHTDDAALERIRRMEAILPARGDMGFEAGVHVEVEPFGSATPGETGPKEETGAFKGGAFVEFDAPGGMVRTPMISPRNTAIIPTAVDQPLSLRALNPRYVKVRRHIWQFWREPA